MGTSKPSNSIVLKWSKICLKYVWNMFERVSPQLPCSTAIGSWPLAPIPWWTPVPSLGRRHPELAEIVGPLPPAWPRARTSRNWGSPGEFLKPAVCWCLEKSRTTGQPMPFLSGNDVQPIQARDFWVPYSQTPDKPKWALVQLANRSSTNLWFSNDWHLYPPIVGRCILTQTHLPKATYIKVQLLPSQPVFYWDDTSIHFLQHSLGGMRNSTAHVRSHRFQACSAKTQRPHSGWWSL